MAKATTVRFTDELYQRLDVASARTGLPVNSIVIAACLECLQGWTGEIIVCDMESTDETVEIAESMGATILHHPLIANFDAARNFSAAHARFPWILFLWDFPNKALPGPTIEIQEAKSSQCSSTN